MINYFKLQYRIFNRFLTDWIKYPFLIIFIFPFIFVLSYNICSEKLPYGNYFFLLLLIQSLLFLSKKERNNFLQLNFKKKEYMLIRLVENLILSIPFIVIEIINYNYLYSLIIVILAGFMSFLTFTINYSFVLPTPFKHSFEFIYIFRKLFLLFLGCIVLAIIGVNVKNFNLTIFSIFVHYSMISILLKKTESIYFIWLYKKTTKQFLIEKIKHLTINTTIIILPCYIVVLYGFPEKYFYIISSYIAGVIMVLSTSIMKYANFTSPFILETIVGFIIILSLAGLFSPLFLIAVLIISLSSVKKNMRFIKNYLKC